MKAAGVSVYFNCEDVMYSGRDNQATIEKLKDNVVDSADESSYMYSKSTDLPTTFIHLNINPLICSWLWHFINLFTYSHIIYEYRGILPVCKHMQVTMQLS